MDSSAQQIILYVDVPMASFRPRWSREYQDSYPVPPPATVYGMLLSLIGCDWHERQRYAGVRLALAFIDLPQRSRVFRKFRRVRQSGTPDPLADRRPDYQELMLWMKFWAIINDGDAEDSLVSSIRTTMDMKSRRDIRRYGGLCLGESSNLVNEISEYKKIHGSGHWLVCDPSGDLQLPVWVTHPRHSEAGEESCTVLRTFRIGENESLILPTLDNKSYWIHITPH